MSPTGHRPAVTGQSPLRGGLTAAAVCRRLSVRLAAVALAAAAAMPVPGAAQSAQPGQAAPAEAVGSGPLETSIVVEMLLIEQGPGGKEMRRWVPATRLSAGDEVSYTVRVRNPGKEPVSDVVVTKRMPFGVHYQRGSATGPAAEVQFSIDGGNTYAPADQFKPAVPTGKSKGKAVRKPPPPEYTHVRWILTRPLDPGATALLRFRAKFS